LAAGIIIEEVVVDVKILEDINEHDFKISDRKLLILSRRRKLFISD